MRLIFPLLGLCGALLGMAAGVSSADAPFDGLNLGLGNLYRVSPAQSRSISPENRTGEPGKGGMSTEGTGKKASRELGQGWKVSPSIPIPAQSTVTLAANRDNCPLFSSMAVCVNPGSAFNCYWQMPFRQHCRITLEKKASESTTLYYQVNYMLTTVPADAGYFHAQFHRENPLSGVLVPTGAAYAAPVFAGSRRLGHGEINSNLVPNRSSIRIIKGSLLGRDIGSGNEQNSARLSLEEHSLPFSRMMR